jgi:hypothetical protein
MQPKNPFYLQGSNHHHHYYLCPPPTPIILPALIDCTSQENDAKSGFCPK